MKLPLGIIARFALKIAARAAAKQALDPARPAITVDSAKKALAEAAQEELLRQVAKRAG